MKRWMRLGVVAGLALVAGTGLLRGQDQASPKRTVFMRQKLEFSKKVLEGLTVEDYDTIAKNARALRLLSQAAEWEVPTIPSATDYIAYTNEFQRYTDELALRARQKNLDGATLAYLKLTMNCIHCHKYVRMPKQ
jgi:cytochrome c556